MLIISVSRDLALLSVTQHFFKCKNDDIGVVCGCFNGNLEKFSKKVRNTHGYNKYAKEYLAMIEVVKIHFGKENNNE